MSSTSMGPQKRRILLVEDYANMLRALELLLEPLFDVVTALDGAAAERCFATRRFDVALVDYRLPDTNGAELLKRLRLRDPAVRRVMISGHVVPEYFALVDTGLLHGFLVKPASLEDIVQVCSGSAAELRRSML